MKLRAHEKKKALNKKSNQAGFSLIEILIALTLLGLAGTFVAGKILDNLAEGQVLAAKNQMNGIKGILKEYKRKCGLYPTTEQGLEALVSKPTSGKECKRYPADGFIEDGIVPLDPWDNEYIYTSDGRKFEIVSLGSDGIEGGEGFEADISSDPKKNSSGDDSEE